MHLVRGQLHLTELTPLAPKYRLSREFVAKSFGGQKLKDKYPWVVTLRSSANKDYIPHEPDGQQLVDVKLRETRDTLIVVETPPTVGICNGDSGGPLFQTNIENKNVQMGVMSGGLSCEEHYINSLTDNYVEDGVEDNFTDVRQYLDWICEKTGICPRN
ncbi:hypothetical protein COOONC_17837 [Cooperia oncophora]